MVPRCLALALRPALRPPRLLAALGARHASRDSAAHGMVAEEHDAASSLLITTLPTVPGAQLTVTGQCASLTVKTNMETYVAEAWAELDGRSVDARSVADFDVSEGEIKVSVTEAVARLTLTVPAAFEVSVGMSRGACDVDVAGWLEGSVDVSTDSGSVSVKTVKGMLTRLRTGAGDVSVGSVDGNLDAETGDGSVTLGKIVGEEVRAIAGGRASNALRAKAIYAKRTELSSSGAMQACRPPPAVPSRCPPAQAATLSAQAATLSAQAATLHTQAATLHTQAATLCIRPEGCWPSMLATRAVHAHRTRTAHCAPRTALRMHGNPLTLTLTLTLHRSRCSRQSEARCRSAARRRARGAAISTVSA